MCLLYQGLKETIFAQCGKLIFGGKVSNQTSDADLSIPLWRFEQNVTKACAAAVWYGMCSCRLLCLIYFFWN